MSIKDNDKVKTVVIVLNYNDALTCVEFINESYNYDVIDRIIIVDNNSTDDSVEVISRYTDDKVLLVETGVNNGYAAGNNYGMRFAVNTFPCLSNIIISNPDIHVKEDDLQRIICKLDGQYGMTTGLIYNYDPKANQKTLASNFGWRTPRYSDMISNCFLISYKLKRRVFHTSMYLDWEREKNNAIILADSVPGCFFVLDADAAKAIDYMDERTFLFGEETILGYRLKSMGYSVCIVNDTEILHENSVTIKKEVKSNKTKRKYRRDAEIIYIKEYLHCNKIKIELYKFCYWLGQYEKRLVTSIASALRK